MARILCLFLLLTAFLPRLPLLPLRAAGAPSRTEPAAPTDDVPDDPEANRDYPNPPLELLSPYALVLDMSRNMTLYSREDETPVAMPLAGQLMTLLLTLENLQVDQMATVSGNAASYASSDRKNLHLAAGDQVRVDYLMMAVHYTDSAVASTVLAEAISQSEERFLERMRQRAGELGLEQTTFTRLPGQGAGRYYQSSLKDTATLLRQLLQIPFYQNLIRQRTYTYVDEATDRHYFFSNPLDAAWTVWSDNRVTGSAYASAGGRESAAYLASHEGVDIMFLLQGPAPAGEQGLFQTTPFNQDVRLISGEIFSYYDVTTLHRKYQPLLQSMEIGGYRVPLLSLQTVNYIHPVGIDTVRTSTLVRSSDAERLPVEQYQKVGQLVYTLTNGTVITADVGAAEAVYPSETFWDRLLIQIRMYPNLVRAIVIIGIIVAVVGGIRGVRALIRRYYAWKIRRLDADS